MMSVCICTHSPDLALLGKVVQAICKQTLSKQEFNVLVIDNASDPGLDLNAKPLSLLVAAGIQTALLKEPRLGVAYARVLALKESHGEAVLFVDDDNVLDEEFLKRSKMIMESHPEVGCFSGKIKVHTDVQVPIWVHPLLSSLAIRDAGETPIVDWFREGWSLWLPVATASMVVRRAVIERFLFTHAARDDFSSFGRRGKTGLLSGEDYFIALSAADVGLKCGYFPNLLMWHVLKSERLRFFYMLKLWFSYGLTDLKREVYLRAQPSPLTRSEIFRRLFALDLKNENFRARFCYWVYQMVYVSGRTLRSVRLIR